MELINKFCNYKRSGSGISKVSAPVLVREKYNEVIISNIEVKIYESFKIKR